MNSMSSFPDNPSAAVLMPIVAAIFGVYIVIGLGMPLLPLYVHRCLGFGPFVVGLVSGSQFAAGMISRFWAGHHVDSRGAKHAGLNSVFLASTAAVICVAIVALLAERVLGPSNRKRCL
jgi:hypothetical protein